MASAERMWSFSAVSEAKINKCVSGGAGGIGQPMSMLMAMNPLVKEVSIQESATGGLTDTTLCLFRLVYHRSPV